jgi:hypothetical protein
MESNTMKVAFLDIDGVVATRSSLDEAWCDYMGVPYDRCAEHKAFSLWRGSGLPHPGMSMYQWPFCRTAICNLYTLLRETRCKFVVCSSWRMGDDPEQVRELERLFHLKGLHLPILSVTKRFGPRGEEIQEWLNRHPEVENYVVIDDECLYDILPYHPNKCVNPEFVEGFTAEHLQAAIQILSN